MDQLRAMRVFARVIDEQGFAKAARALDMAPAVVTRVIGELETHLGARLLNRTTRRIALTDAGEHYLDSVRRILQDVEDAETLAGEATRNPRGHLRVLVPPSIAVHQLAKHLPAFRAKYPDVSLDISANGTVETIGDDHDITILSLRGTLDGDFIARRLARSEVILCASPEYLDRRGRPQHPSELDGHEALIPAVSAVARGLVFHTGAWGDDEPGGEEYVYVPQRDSALRTNHIDMNYAAALAGLGIAGLPSLVAEDALMEHALERVLPAWRLFSQTIWAAIPTRKLVPARTRAFMDFLVGIFGGEDRDPWLAAAGCETLDAACALQRQKVKPADTRRPDIGSSSVSSGANGR